MREGCVIRAAGAAKRPPYDWAALVSRFAAAKSRVKLGLQLSGRDAEKLQACLVEQLAQRDIHLVEQSSDVDLMVHGNLRWRWAGEVMGSYMVHVDLNLRLTDVQGGRTLGAINEQLKAGRPQKAMAVQSASNKLCLKVAPTLAERVDQALSR